jgi:uncharacterized membrane protein
MAHCARIHGNNLRGEKMKGNFAATVLVVVGALALAVNLGLFEIDLVQIVRTWWPLGLILLGVALFFTPDADGRKKD